MYTVYMHRTPSNKVYIGITKEENVCERFGSNGARYRNQVFGRAIKKYGWNNIEHLILKTGLTETEAKEEEIQLIAKYNSTDSRFGYNITPGGDTVSVINREKTSKAIKELWKTDEYRQKQAARIVTEETRKRQSNSHLGKKFSIETRQKMSDSNKGKHNFTEEQRKKLSEIVREQHRKEKEMGIKRDFSKCKNRSKGAKWYNNGIINTRSKTGCPEGFIPGRLKKRYVDKEDVF